MSMAEECGVKKLYGIDINRHAVEKAKERLGHRENYKFLHGSADKIDFADNSMDVITMCEVIEHVPSELRSGVFKEIHRLLKPGGRLIVTTPYRGLFHWLDPANMRLRLPHLFNVLSRMLGGVGRDQGYQGEKHDIVWHHHFTQDELQELWGEAYELEKTRYRGVLIAPLAQYLMFPFYRLENFNNPIYKFIRKCKNLELEWDAPPGLAFNVLVVLNKKS